MKFAKQALGAVGGSLLGGGLLGGSLIKAVAGGKKKKPSQPLPGATRDEAAALIAQQDELAKRRGGLDDILTGTRGAEAVLRGGRLIVGN